jgi:hypothetical protein
VPEVDQITTTDKIGLVGRAKVIWTLCPKCDKGRWVRLQYHRKYPILLCNSCIQSHSLTNEYKGRKTNKAGYILVLLKSIDPYYRMAQKSGYVLEHRYIMAKHFGRPLESWEIVHHKNRNKTDNSPKNLHLYLGNQHSQSHIEWKLITRIKQLEQRVILIEAENELLRSQTEKESSETLP